MINLIALAGYVLSSLATVMFMSIAMKVNRKKDIKYWFVLWFFISLIYFI